MQEGLRKIDLIGDHPLMQRVKALIDRVGPTDATVLVLGESGTGKEVVARAVHAASPRAEKPFVAVNCGAIPAELLESEMFGHERGSFTGAVESREGMFQVANTGTIFLDEVAETSPALQVKLLRVLQDKEIRPVGGRRILHVDVRVIAATNKDLGDLVARGLFREDLYYRLEVVPIDMPPLRERRSDIALLVNHFLRRQNAKRPGHEVSIADDAMAELCSMDWPGNVRELENTIERLGILCEDARVTLDDVRSGRRPSRRSEDLMPSLSDEGFDLAQAVEDFENRLIEEALRRTKGNKQAAARMLGVKRTTLASKLRRRGDLDPDSDDAEEDEGEIGGTGTATGRRRPTLQ